MSGPSSRRPGRASDSPRWPTDSPPPTTRSGLQAICDRLGPADIAGFADRWWPRLPLPLTPADRAHGYWWDFSMRQIEVSRTMVSDQTCNGRAFFEALVADNLDLGRPEKVELIFGRRIPRNRQTTGVFATRVVTRGVDVTIDARYKHSRVKQYFKLGRALRIETVINDPTDVGVLRRIVHLDELVVEARAVNRRLLDAERVGQGCVLASPAFERIARPSHLNGRRAPALRFGDPRVMALAGALAVSSNLIGGFSNKEKLSRPVDQDLLGDHDLLDAGGGAFDELAAAERGAGTDEGDQVGRVHRAPAGLGGLDELERHGQAGRSRAGALGDLAAVPDGGKGRFDGIRCPQMDPVLGRVVVELQQHLQVVGDLGAGVGELAAVFDRERLRRDPGVVTILGVEDLLHRPG